MKMPAYLPRRGKAAAEVLGYDRRLKGTQAYAHMGRGLGDRLYHVRKPRLSRQVYAVGRDLYPRQHDLPVALSVELRRLRGSVLKRQAAQAAAGVWDDAVGAEVHAPVLYLQHRARPARDGSRRQHLELAALERLVDIAAALAGAVGFLHRLDELSPVRRAEDNVRAELRDLLGLYLRIAPAYRDDGSGVLLLEPAYHLAGFAPALGGHGAGVYYHGVGKLAGYGGLMPMLLQKTFHRLSLILVDLTAESGYNIFHRFLLFCDIGV